MSSPATSLSFVPALAARVLPKGSAALVQALQRRGRDVWPLRRRGCDHGFVVPLRRPTPDAAEIAARWRTAEPVHLPGLLAPRLPPFAPAIAATLAMFARLRRGGALLPELQRRLRDRDDFAYTGSGGGDDAREIERLHVDAVRGDASVAEDLWAMLAWIASPGQRDVSLRLRFSFGPDSVEERLQADEALADWAAHFAEAAFPEGAAIVGSVELQSLLRQLLRRPFRLSERIVYNNAPGGGAMFHHDAETSQLGVVFSQLQGHTAWLAIGKRRLARLLVHVGAARTATAAMARLDRDDDAALARLLNHDAGFTAQLAARGALFVLQAGDCMLLPSHGTDDVAWHSVFALGERPSLAHSYGIFARAVAGRDGGG